MVKEVLQGKKILFLSVSFFSYEKIIKDRLTSLGANVFFYDERVSNSILAKGLIRFNRNLYKHQIDTYYKKIISKIENERFDYFLVIKGEAIPLFFLEKVKALNPEIKSIYYNFDSFVNNPNGLLNLDYFDMKFTFDRSDAIKYNLHFRPLFFSNEYEELYNNSKDNMLSSFEYASLFIGSAHTDRYLISEKVSNWCKQKSLKYYSFYFSPSKLVFYFKKRFDRSFKDFDINKVSFNSLSHNQIINLYSKTLSILDINHPSQVGLTMRTFEVLGSGKKLITTNADIINYPFYNPNNILIINRKNIIINEDFFKENFVALEDTDRRMMSLDGWLDCLFNMQQDEYWYGKKK
ncbi:CgeB family protein [Flavobacterium oreochromis]|uniref:Lipopolysaccharide biosynthesis protein n=1 Tax=Flavobacterium columnare TaxID=996 RepID=A0A246GDW6_9FLAO|nr:lipopolysaccharide biosynthesis protein [Flavobacterium oreochromis]OWP79603.1 hypothetical protein BWK62_01370 [Flavobacterium oreochromis]